MPKYRGAGPGIRIRAAPENGAHVLDSPDPSEPARRLRPATGIATAQ